MRMAVAVTAHPDDLRAAADVLTKSLERGDWDDDAAEMFSRAVSKLTAATQAADAAGSPLASATMRPQLAAEVASILECDARADTELAAALTAFCAALSGTPDPVGVA